MVYTRWSVRKLSLESRIPGRLPLPERIWPSATPPLQLRSRPLARWPRAKASRFLIVSLGTSADGSIDAFTRTVLSATALTVSSQRPLLAWLTNAAVQE